MFNKRVFVCSDLHDVAESEVYTVHFRFGSRTLSDHQCCPETKQRTRGLSLLTVVRKHMLTSKHRCLRSLQTSHNASYCHPNNSDQPQNSHNRAPKDVAPAPSLPCKPLHLANLMLLHAHDAIETCRCSLLTVLCTQWLYTSLCLMSIYIPVATVSRGGSSFDPVYQSMAHSGYGIAQSSAASSKQAQTHQVLTLTTEAQLIVITSVKYCSAKQSQVD